MSARTVRPGSAPRPPCSSGTPTGCSTSSRPGPSQEARLHRPGRRSTQPEDRTLQSVFTHDHFSPSTHQQVGLYAALIIEPRDTQWTDSETGQPTGRSPGAGRSRPAARPTRDGGPTSWQATDRPQEHAPRRAGLPRIRPRVSGLPARLSSGQRRPSSQPYSPYAGPIRPAALHGAGRDPANAIVRPARRPAQWPEHSSAARGTGHRTLNYRNEPIPFRVARTAHARPGADKSATDLAHAFRSIERVDPDLNKQPAGPIAPVVAVPLSPSPSRAPSRFDPYTPLLRDLRERPGSDPRARRGPPRCGTSSIFRA